jgi:hypothetical protein
MFFFPALFLALFTIGSFGIPRDEPVEIQADEIEHVQEVE